MLFQLQNHRIYLGERDIKDHPVLQDAIQQSSEELTGLQPETIYQASVAELLLYSMASLNHIHFR